MGRGRKPKGKHTLTLHFDTKVGIENWLAWCLDGGGEQQSQYYSNAWGKSWVYVKPDEDACPECEYSCDLDEHRRQMYSDTSISKMDISCRNCDHKYSINNPYK